MGGNQHQLWSDHLKRSESLWKEGFEDQAAEEIQKALESASLNCGTNSIEYINCLISSGDRLIKMGRGMEALGLYNSAREIADYLLGDKNFFNPRILLGISSAYALQQFEEEAKLYKDLALNSLPNTSWDDTQTLVLTLAELAPALGNNEIFKELALKTVNSIDSVGIEDLPTLSKPLLMIASNLFVIGDSSNAVTILKRLIDFHERFEGETLTHFANCLELGALVAESASDFETAIRWMALACEIHSDLHGKESLEVAQATVPLARLLLQCGEFSETIRICEDILPQLKPSSDDEEYKLEEALLRKFLGEAYCAVQDFDSARKHLLISYEIYRIHERTSDPALSDVVQNLGVIALSEGALDDALSFLGKAYAIREKAYGTPNENVAQSLVALGTCHEAKGNSKEAEQCFKRANEMEVALFGVRPTEQTEIVSYEESYDDDTQTEIIEDVSDIPSQPVAKAANPNLKAVVSIVRAAKTLIQTQQEGEAIELLNEAISLIESLGGGGQPSTTSALPTTSSKDIEEFS